MPRLGLDNHTEPVKEYLGNFHSDSLDEVKKAVATDTVVVVGMAGNPYVRKIRKKLRNKKMILKIFEIFR